MEINDKNYKCLVITRMYNGFIDAGMFVPMYEVKLVPISEVENFDLSYYKDEDDDDDDTEVEWMSVTEAIDFIASEKDSFMYCGCEEECLIHYPKELSKRANIKSGIKKSKARTKILNQASMINYC